MLPDTAPPLPQGLRIAPPEAPVTGYMFDKGVYFADMVSKSANYCFTSRASPTGILMLCDVALGTPLERLQVTFRSPQPVCNAWKALPAAAGSVPWLASPVGIDSSPTIVPMAAPALLLQAAPPTELPRPPMARLCTVHPSPPSPCPQARLTPAIPRPAPGRVQRGFRRVQGEEALVLGQGVHRARPAGERTPLALLLRLCTPSPNRSDSTTHVSRRERWWHGQQHHSAAHELLSPPTV